MKNWSQRIEWNPSIIAYPTSETEVQTLVEKALQKKQNVRIIGSGHSFNPLWVTEDVLVSLDKYQGLVSVDKETLQVTIKAGTKLNTLGDLLFEQGMAMENLGDIDVQSLAGTIGTGTHGTGLKFGTISTQVRALQFVNGKGKIVACSETENRSLFKAAQVSLGALGIITQITLQCVPAYKLELQNRKENLHEVLKTFKERIANNRNFEFYYFPHSQNVLTKSSNVVTGEADKVGLANYLREYVLENYIFKILCEMGRFFPSQNKRISKISASSVPDVRKVFYSHKVYATQRLVRFNEMEYNVPLEAYGDVFKEVIRTVETGNFAVHFPIESRVVKGDDVYLSPAYGRDSAYIACHVYNKKDYKPYFKALEDIFLAHGGRPHWGKMHTLEKPEIAARYPMFEAFSQHRREQDPEGLFLNG
ncbi:MAG: D-arabinono-1,4-lactone oxidase, partial [Chitinophagales bacterium]